MMQSKIKLKLIYKMTIKIIYNNNLKKIIQYNLILNYNLKKVNIYYKFKKMKKEINLLSKYNVYFGDIN